MEAAAAGDHFVVGNRDDLHPRQAKLILRMFGDAFRHYDPSWGDRQRIDNGGVVFMVDCRDVAEAQSVMEQLPLAKEKLVDYEYTPLTPLSPLGILLGTPAAQ